MKILSSLWISIYTYINDDNKTKTKTTLLKYIYIAIFFAFCNCCINYIKIYGLERKKRANEILYLYDTKIKMNIILAFIIVNKDIYINIG